jgi:voltage-gated potassium channel Kch
MEFLCISVRRLGISLCAGCLHGQIGFVAFTTIGYGEFSPATPAGRSVFVVWALLGVGTMTILISGPFQIPSPL